MNMAKKKQREPVPIEDAMFFPEDFRKLQGNCIIYIKEGFIKNLDEPESKEKGHERGDI